MKLEEQLSQLTGLNLRRMTTEELKINMQTVAMHTNRRLRALEKSGIVGQSKAYDVLQQKIGTPAPKLTSKGKTRQELIKEIKMGVNFLQSKTSTVAGTRERIGKIKDLLLEDMKGDERSKKEKVAEIESILNNKDFWSLYREIEEILYYFDSDDLLQEVRKVYDQTNDAAKGAKMIEKQYRIKKADLDVEFESDDNLMRRRRNE